MPESKARRRVIARFYWEEPQHSYRMREACIAAENSRVTGITQEIIARIDPLLDAGDTESAGKLPVEVDQASLRAVLIEPDCRIVFFAMRIVRTGAGRWTERPV